MEFEDYLEPEVALAVTATALLASPQVRGVLRRGLVVGMAGVMMAGDTLGSFSRGARRGAAQALPDAASTVENTAQTTMNTVETTMGNMTPQGGMAAGGAGGVVAGAAVGAVVAGPVGAVVGGVVGAVAGSMAGERAVEMAHVKNSGESVIITTQSEPVSVSPSGADVSSATKAGHATDVPLSQPVVDSEEGEEGSHRGRRRRVTKETDE